MFQISLTRWLREIVLVAIGVLIGTLAVTVINAHGGDPGQIHACVITSMGQGRGQGGGSQQVLGQVRIVGPNDMCDANESPVDWNITGPQGLQGEPGEPGPVGPPGVSGYEIVVAEHMISFDPGDQGRFLDAVCPAGKKVIGGGYSSGGFFTFLNSSPVSDYGWQVLVVNREDFSFSAPVWVRAICANVVE